MKKHAGRCVVFLSLVLCAAPPLFAAARKTIYLKPFAIVQGLPAGDQAGMIIKDYISEEIIATGQYSITSDDEVRQVIQNEELKMSLDACYDDACIKKLMESIRTDYIIYGNVSYVDGKFYVTAKILDRTSGAVVLRRVKTLRFMKRDYIERASKALGTYLISGKEDAVRDFEDYVKEREAGRDEPKRLIGRKSNVVGRAPLLRLGYGFSGLEDSDYNSIYNQQIVSILLDLFVWRGRDTAGNGFDFYLRTSLRAYKMSSGKLDKLKSLEPAIPAGATLASDMENLEIWGLGAGVRYVRGVYLYGVLWQGYLSVTYQYSLLLDGTDVLVKTSPTEEEEIPMDVANNSPFGIVGAAGVEIGFSPYVGLFAEFDYGYIPLDAWGKTRNIGGFAFMFGLTLRTSFLD